MPGIKLTKNEAKKQKDSLKRFQRYLPTLILKKRQLQMVIRKVEEKVNEVEKKKARLEEMIQSWAGIFCENVGLENLVRINSVKKGIDNVAGVDIPVFSGIEIAIESYDLSTFPLWVDKAVSVLKDLISLDAEIDVLREGLLLLAGELRTTTQRVNLFEKVKIPEARENIRRINIYLGDQQTAAVVRGKMAKNKLVEV